MSLSKAAGGVAPDKQIAEVAENARIRLGTGPQRNIDLSLLGIAPWNRGKLGVSPFHVSDVQHSISSDGLSRIRYREICVIRVPASELSTFHQLNRQLLAACPDLPPFSEKMIYACLTKCLCYDCICILIRVSVFLGCSLPPWLCVSS